MLYKNFLSSAAKNPNKKALIYLSDGEEEQESLDFKTLSRKVDITADYLAEKALFSKSVLLIYSEVIDFTIAFLACQKIGVIAIPMFMPKSTRHFSRLSNIIIDSKATTVLCNQQDKLKIVKGITEINNEECRLEVCATDNIPDDEVNSLSQSRELNEPISFIQYTSGSTGKPKGVVITHQNLSHNQQLIKETFGCDENAVILSWLPFYHDMGLIGNILHSLYVGATCVLMSPYHFIQKPSRWLAAIGQYKVTHSGGPNFAFDMCVDKIPIENVPSFDLSSWKVAYNGSEPIQAGSISRFTEKFALAGFQKKAITPCYGLAEATLLVAGKPLNDSKITTNTSGKFSSGKVASGMLVKIIDPETKQVCPEGVEGEICISGESVTLGYWGKDNTNLFYKLDSSAFLRTGDIGLLQNNELTVIGRLKEMFIVRGENYYPYDIEQAIFMRHNEIETNGVVAVNIGKETEELGIIVEVKRSSVYSQELGALLRSICGTVIDVIGIEPYDIVLVSPRSIPRTSSGKLQRLKCAEQYHNDELIELLRLNSIEDQDQSFTSLNLEDLANTVKETGTSEDIQKYLLALISQKSGISVPTHANLDILDLNQMGLDSLRGMELINELNQTLEIQLDSTNLFKENGFLQLSNTIEGILLLKNQSNIEGGEILI